MQSEKIQKILFILPTCLFLLVISIFPFLYSHEKSGWLLLDRNKSDFQEWIVFDYGIGSWEIISNAN